MVLPRCPCLLAVLCIAGLLQIASATKLPLTRPQWQFQANEHLTGLFPSVEASQQFLANDFQQAWQYYSRGTPPRMAANVKQALSKGYGILMAARGIAFQTDQGQPSTQRPPSWQEFLSNRSYASLSMIVKPELLNTEQQHSIGVVAKNAIQRALTRVFETSVTQHLYASRERGMALQPHTDGGDVFVQQLVGEKHWTVCVPQPKGCSECNDADKALLQEVRKEQFEGQWQDWNAWLVTLTARRCIGCTRYQWWMLKSMACKNITLTAGDVLYLPRGVIHVATTTNTTSIHMTYQLKTMRHTWAELSYADQPVLNDANYWLLYLGQSSQAAMLVEPAYRQLQVCELYLEPGYFVLSDISFVSSGDRAGMT